MAAGSTIRLKNSESDFPTIKKNWRNAVKKFGIGLEFSMKCWRKISPFGEIPFWNPRVQNESSELKKIIYKNRATCCHYGF